MSLVFAILGVVGTVLTTVQVLLTRRFVGRRLPSSGPRAGFVSILKPVCGLDDELEQNLEAFTALRGITYEVIISAETFDDPALAVVERVMRKHPRAPFKVVLDEGSRHGVVNRKVERLIAAARVAAGDVLLISDSNARVTPDDVATTLAAFEDPTVGCVSNVFTGYGARSVGAVIEALHLLAFVAPGAVLAATVGVPCVVGKSMALTRRAFDSIGGFEPFRHVLAEDQAIGLAVRKAGFEVVLSPVVVRNVIVDRSLARAVDRQVRWNKIRYAFSHATYAAELLLNPLPFALVAAVLEPAHFLAIPPCVAATRFFQAALLNQVTRAGLGWKSLAATPLLDLVMLYGWAIPFFSDRVSWRGYEARIGRGTQLLERLA